MNSLPWGKPNGTTDGWRGDGHHGVRSGAEGYASSYSQPNLIFQWTGTDGGVVDYPYELHNAAASWTELRIQSNKPITKDEGESRSFVLTKTTSTGLGTTAPHTQTDFLGVVTMTIPKGKTLSEVVTATGTAASYIQTVGSFKIVRLDPTWTGSNQSVTLNLLPIEVKVHQPEGFKAPNDAERSYNHAPSTESLATDYFSVWRWEKVKVELRGIPESMLASLPPNFIKWSTDQNASKTNVLEYEVFWNQVSRYTVMLEIGAFTHRVYFDVPKVGDRNEEEIKEWIVREFGISGALAARDISYGTRDYVGAMYPIWNAKQDAIKHAAWAAGIAAYFGEQAAQIILDSHEKSGFLEGYQAFTSTMDNFNNGEGIDLGRGYVEKSSRPSIATWVSTFAQAYDDGTLYVWMPHDKSPRMRDGCEGYLRYSDKTHIIQP
jgi:hypothetical protein